MVDQRARALDRDRQRERTRRHLPRREVEQPAGGTGDPLQAVLHQLQVDALLVAEALGLQQPVDGVLHAADRVVDLVSDTGRQRADAGQPRAEHQRALLLLGLLDRLAHRVLQRAGLVGDLRRHAMEGRDQRIELGHALALGQLHVVAAGADRGGGGADRLQRPADGAARDPEQHGAEQQRRRRDTGDRGPQRQRRRRRLLEARLEPQVADHVTGLAQRVAVTVGDLQQRVDLAGVDDAGGDDFLRERVRVAMQRAERVQVDTFVRRPAAGDDDVVVQLVDRTRGQQPPHHRRVGRGGAHRAGRVDALEFGERRVGRLQQRGALVLQPVLLRQVHHDLHAADRQHVQQQRQQQDAPGERHGQRPAGKRARARRSGAVAATLTACPSAASSSAAA